MKEILHTEAPKNPITRRTFIIGAAAGAGALTLYEIAKKFGVNKMLFPHETALLDIRPEPDKQVIGVFTAYEDYRAKNPDLHLDPLRYTRPDNYFDLGKLIGKSPTAIDMEKNDEPGSSFVRFSIEDIHGTKDLLQLDPGSGILAKIRTEITATFGADPLTNTALLDNPDVVAYTAQRFGNWFADVKDFVARATQDKRISTSALKLYFLIQNNGDIMRSLWDTVLWLKIAVRNNPDDLSFVPQLSLVKFLAKHIDDTFASEPLSDVLKKHIDPYDADGIIPRAGILYHGENIEVLAGCMDPHLIPPIVEAYYFVKALTGGQSAKKESDERIAKFIPNIKELLEKYTT